MNNEIEAVIHKNIKLKNAPFLTGLVYKFHIILKRRHLVICDHSIFLIIEEIVF